MTDTEHPPERTGDTGFAGQELQPETKAPDESLLAELLPVESRRAEPLPVESQSEIPPAVWHAFDPRQIQYERLSGWIVVGVVLVGMLIGLTITLIANWPSTLAFVIASSICAAILLWIVIANIYLPPLSHARAAWLCDQRGFQFRKGIWWRKVTSVPRSRVQHTDVHQGPIQRSYGLAKLVIHTAGTQNASIDVDGLSHEVATRLRDALIEDRSFDDAV